MAEALKERVREFWEAEPCGTRHVGLTEGTPEFFARLERQRAEREPFIERFARFDEQRGKRVLEVGVGPGTDFVRFARAGAVATGLDLTAHGVDLTRRRLELEGLRADVRQGDAEQLPFEDGSFDFVYSWGVIHHTESPERAGREIVRVTAPGGRVCVMVYHRHSLVAAQSWLVNGVARGRPWRSLSDLIWHHHESVGTRAYTVAEARSLFPGLADLSVSVVVTAYDMRIGRGRYLPSWTRRLVPSGLGWFLVLEGEKRES